MIKYIETNTRIDVISLDGEFLKNTFTPAVYSVRKDKGGYFLEKLMPEFNLPSKIYGSTSVRTQRTIDAFLRRSGTTGILLTGTKGTGKTLLAKNIANQMISKGYPVILVADPFYGEEFNSFIQSLGECMLLFDEFAKTYYDNEFETSLQPELLSLFDGTSSSKKLIAVTENSYLQIDEHYKNRPSRIYYSWQYSGIESEVVHGYCDDNLLAVEYRQDILDLISRTLEFTFDLLQAIVEEANAFKDSGIPFKEFAEDLNIEAFTAVKCLEIISFDNDAIVKEHGGIEWKPTKAMERVSEYEYETSVSFWFDEVSDTSVDINRICFIVDVSGAHIKDDIVTFKHRKYGEIKLRYVTVPDHVYLMQQMNQNVF